MSRAAFQEDRREAPPDLIILQKCKAMIQYGYVALRQVPAFERHVSSQEVRRTMWQLMRLIIVCNKRYHKKTTMQDIDVELAVLREQIQAVKDLGFLSFKKYEHWAKLNDEIGRLLGGWMKSVNQPVGGAR